MNEWYIDWAMHSHNASHSVRLTLSRRLSTTPDAFGNWPLTTRLKLLSFLAQSQPKNKQNHADSDDDDDVPLVASEAQTNVFCQQVEARSWAKLGNYMKFDIDFVNVNDQLAIVLGVECISGKDVLLEI